MIRFEIKLSLRITCYCVNIYLQDLRQIKSRNGTHYGFWSNRCSFFISRHYIWHISCIFSRCIAFIALRWIDLTRLVLSSVIFKLLITTIDCLGQNILLAADWLSWTPQTFRKVLFLTILTRFCQAYRIEQQKYVSEGLMDFLSHFNSHLI